LKSLIFFSKKKQSEEEAQSRNKREESFFGLFWSRVLPPKQSHFLHLHKRSEFSLSLSLRSRRSELEYFLFSLSRAETFYSAHEWYWYNISKAQFTGERFRRREVRKRIRLKIARVDCVSDFANYLN